MIIKICPDTLGLCLGEYPMKKVIIHVGQYKTGSTSIQKLMWEGRNKLLARGVLYPHSFVRDCAHFLITDLLRKEYHNPNKSVQLNPLREEIEKTSVNTVVISCESLSGATVRWFAPDMMKFMWQRLVDELDGFDLRVMFYVRRQDESINSRIIQEIKGQARKSSIEYEPFLYKKSSLNYYYFYGLLERIFGKGSVDIRIYDRNNLVNADVRHDFMEYLGLDGDVINVQHNDDNVAPSAKLVGFYRVVNSMRLESGDYEIVNNGLWRELSSAESPRAVILGTKERAHIMSYFRESNNMFVSDCVSDKHKKLYEEIFTAPPMSVESNVFIDAVEALEILGRKGFRPVRLV